MITNSKKIDIYLQLLLVVTICLLYSVSINYPMYDKWDDLYYIIENQHLTFSAANITYWFRHACLGCYVPITMISYMFDYSLWEYISFGYHLQNIFWHIVATIAIYHCFRLFKIKPWIAFFLCLIFAVHPQRVESVVWLSERKDVLCAAFYFLSIFFYIKNYNKNFSITAFILFILAMLSKPMAITLPIVLVLYEIWQKEEGREQEEEVGGEENVVCSQLTVSNELKSEFSGQWPEVGKKEYLSTKDTKDTKKEFKKIRAISVIRGYIFKLLPYFLIMLIFIPVMFLAQGNSVNHKIALIQKIYAVLFNIYWYATQTLFCTDLNPIYPLIHLYHSILEVSLFYFGIITLGFILFFRNRQNFIFSFLPLVFCYLVTLAPVIGFIRLGNTDHADRYSYIPSVFVLLIIANIFSRKNINIWGEKDVKRKPFFRKNSFVFVVLLLFSSILIYHNYQYQKIWKNQHNLFIYSTNINNPNFNSLLLLGGIEYISENYTEVLRVSDMLKNNQDGLLMATYFKAKTLTHFDKNQAIELLLKIVDKTQNIQHVFIAKRQTQIRCPGNVAFGKTSKA